MTAASTLQFYNTLTRQVEPFEPIEPGKVRLYVCGPTVYDKAHLGHARCYITWDVLFRFLQWSGYDVTYARNVTDVDDKILNKARTQNRPPHEVASEFYESFKADMAALNVLPPTEDPHATAYIDRMQAMIGELVDKGFAYVAADGSVYYRTQAKPEYGELSRKSGDSLQAGARVEVDPLKEHPNDFALWKAVSADEAQAEGFGWAAAQGRTWAAGRPGWHIECSAMIRDCLGEQIDIHAGGADLVFPHHENEIAQSEACTGKRPFVRTWMHNGFVNVSGEKMSKSLGNFSTIEGLMERYDANTIRYFLLTHHYRMPVDFTDEALQGAENWVNGLYKLGISPLNPFSTVLPARDLQRVQPDFFKALAHDLNTPKALACLNGMMKQYRGNQEENRGDDILRLSIETALALLGFQPKPIRPGTDVTRLNHPATLSLDEQERRLPEFKRLADSLGYTITANDYYGQLDEFNQLRTSARKEKNWNNADIIRREIELISPEIKVIDLPNGVSEFKTL